MLYITRPEDSLLGYLLDDVLQPTPQSLECRADLAPTRPILSFHQASPCPRHRISFLIEKPFNLQKHDHIPLPVEALSSSTLARLQRRELTLPVTQNVGRDAGDGRYFTDPEIEAIWHLGRKIIRWDRMSLPLRVYNNRKILLSARRPGHDSSPLTLNVHCLVQRLAGLELQHQIGRAHV
jgi:hypothetical protein